MQVSFHRKFLKFVTMINPELFLERLEKVIQFYGLSASQFADRIGVQRSGISHLLTGRNKPSLEFVMKVVAEFREVNLYWLLYGQGSFPQMEKGNDPTSTKTSPCPPSPDTYREGELREKGHDPTSATASKDHRIKKVIIFYRDGSFEAYENDGS